MSAAELDLQHVPEPLQERVRWYVERLQALCGPRLAAVTLYGELPGGAPGETLSLANVCVFDRVDLELLARIARDGRRFGRWGFAAPWPLTPEMIAGSRDSFPLELIDIQQRHAAVSGPDLFRDLQFEREHVRLQCERELKMLDIHLQRGVLAAAGQERMLAHWGRQLAPGLLRVLLGLLWLEGHPRPSGQFELVRAIERVLGHDLIGVRRALDASDTDTWSKFQQLFADVTALGGRMRNDR